MATFGDSRRCDRPYCRKILSRFLGSGCVFRCGHRICQDCNAETDVRLLDEGRTGQAEAEAENNDESDCPVCQQKMLLPRERLKNVPILRQFRIVKEMFDSLGPWFCDDCSDGLPNRADLRCTDCNRNLCEDCESCHVPPGGLARYHRIIKKEEFNKGKDWGPVALVWNDRCWKVKCVLHPEKDLLYLCDECKELKCDTCLEFWKGTCKQVNKKCKRACDVIDNVNTIIDGVLNELNRGIEWAKENLEEVQAKKTEALEELVKLKSKVKDEIHKRHWVNEHLATFEEDKPPVDQLELIDDHILDIQTQCSLIEQKLVSASNGKRLLSRAILNMQEIDPGKTRPYCAILLLAFLQCNKLIRESSFKEDVTNVLEFVTKTKCMYHQNCCDKITAFPESVQTGSVQVKKKKTSLDPLNTRVEEDAEEPLIGGLTVIETINDIIVSDARNKCVKCFAAEKKPCSAVELPEYKYKLKWRSTGGCGTDHENPGVLYTTTSSKMLGLVDNNVVFEYKQDGDVRSVKPSPNIIGGCTHNNAHERLSAKVMFQTQENNAYLSSSIISDALQSGIVLPQFLANLHVTPWFYFTTKTKKYGRVVINMIISGFEKIEDGDKHAVVLFVNNGLLMRRVYMPHEEPAGVTFNTQDNCAYIADYTYNRVVAFTEKGKFAKVFLDEDDGIKKPVGIVFDVQGRLIVAQEDGILKIFRRDDELVGLGVPKGQKPPTYKYFVPAVSSLKDDEQDFEPLRF